MYIYILFVIYIGFISLFTSQGTAATCHNNITLGNTNMVIVECSKTWDNARQYCNDFNGGLLEIYNKDIYKNVKLKLKQNGYDDKLWLGGVKRNGTWYWDSGQQVGFINWGYGQPNPDDENCMVLQRDLVGLFSWYAWRWHDYECNVQHPFICQIYTTTTTESPSMYSTRVTDTTATSTYRTTGIMTTNHYSTGQMTPMVTSTMVTSTKQPTPLASNVQPDSTGSTEYTPETPSTSSTSKTGHMSYNKAEKPGRDTEIGVGVGVAIFVLVVIGVVAGLLIYRRRRKHSAITSGPKRQTSVANDYTPSTVQSEDHYDMYTKHGQTDSVYTDLKESTGTKLPENYITIMSDNNKSSDYSEVNNQYSSINKQPTINSDQVIMVSNDIYDDSDSVMVDNDLYGD